MNCQYCNQEIVYEYRISQKNMAKTKFCSISCRASAKIGVPCGVGRVSPMKGKKHTEDTIRKISQAKIGQVAWNKGMKGLWLNTKFLELNKIQKRENHPSWKGGSTSIGHILRGTQEWKIWRGEVFERDKYTCQECGISGVYLEPHHVTPIRSNRDRVFDINNGITLCRLCHQKTMWKESNFAEKYYAKIMAQV